MGEFVYDGGAHGFLYDGVDYATLHVPRAHSTRAIDIDSDNIVGWFQDDTGEYGFLYDGTTYTTLDVPESFETHAHGIDGNNIVGWFRDDDGSGYHGFLRAESAPIPEPLTVVLNWIGMTAVAWVCMRRRGRGGTNGNRPAAVSSPCSLGPQRLAGPHSEVNS